MVRIHENESEFPLSLSFYYNQLAIVCVCTISFMESKTLLAPEVQLLHARFFFFHWTAIKVEKREPSVKAVLIFIATVLNRYFSHREETTCLSH